jgi:hypothetical protein
MKSKIITFVGIPMLALLMAIRGHSRQKHVPTIPELFSGSAVVVLGKVESIGKHKDPEYQHRYQRVYIRAERMLKQAPTDNPYVDEEINSGLVPIVFPSTVSKKYRIGTRAIWFARYYNNTLWSNDPEIKRPVEKLKEIEALIPKQEVPN